MRELKLHLVWALHGISSRVELFAICTMEGTANLYRENALKQPEIIRAWVESCIADHAYGQKYRLSGGRMITTVDHNA
jgi:hypothetical protein